jgi:catechol 2,3-dioxygenase-like lactoylglutathione lyase family enzyme
MLDHVSLRVSDQERSKQFYAAALAPLGYDLAMENTSGAGFRKTSIPEFWVKQGQVASVSEGLDPAHMVGCGGAGIHVAFASDDRRGVEEFHRAALAAGGRDNGPPALRPEYHPNYFGAFVLDPDGYNVEAVCHRGE